MDYHGRIMNIPQTGLTTPHSSYGYGYKVGHRDARHAAAEICAEAQAEIEDLKRLLKRYRDETPPGNQPHMIAAEIDKLLAK